MTATSNDFPPGIFRFARAFWLLIVLFCADSASAHLALEFPVSRHGPNVLKEGPCGIQDSSRGNNISVFAPGDSIEVSWDEYINHPGHFRIAFDESGENGFQEPICLDNCDSRNMVIEQQAGDPSVLLDAIPDTPSGGLSSVTVKLPDIECDDCTLQVIQVMTDKPPYTIGGNDLYYQCADIVLTSSAIYSNWNQILKMPIMLVNEDPLYNVRLQLDNQNRYSLLDYSTTMEFTEGEESPVANATYSTTSRVLTIVQLQVGDEIFYDARLLLKIDGVFELLGFSYTQQEE
jgi:hypothetical protein